MFKVSLANQSKLAPDSLSGVLVKLCHFVIRVLLLVTRLYGGGTRRDVRRDDAIEVHLSQVGVIAPVVGYAPEWRRCRRLRCAVELAAALEYRVPRRADDRHTA